MFLPARAYSKAQTMLEYLLVMVIIASLAFGAFTAQNGGMLDKTRTASNAYFDAGTKAIMGGHYIPAAGINPEQYIKTNPAPINGGWCPSTRTINGNTVRECACPRPAFGGAFCDEAAVAPAPFVCDSGAGCTLDPATVNCGGPLGLNICGNACPGRGTRCAPNYQCIANVCQCVYAPGTGCRPANLVACNAVLPGNDLCGTACSAVFPGARGTQCGTGQSCVAGVCVCPGGQCWNGTLGMCVTNSVNCPPANTVGCNVSLGVDGCGNACPGGRGSVCSQGGKVCTSGGAACAAGDVACQNAHCACNAAMGKCATTADPDICTDIGMSCLAANQVPCGKPLGVDRCNLACPGGPNGNVCAPPLGPGPIGSSCVANVCVCPPTHCNLAGTCVPRNCGNPADFNCGSAMPPDACGQPTCGTATGRCTITHGPYFQCINQSGTLSCQCFEAVNAGCNATGLSCGTVVPGNDRCNRACTNTGQDCPVNFICSSNTCVCNVAQNTGCNAAGIACGTTVPGNDVCGRACTNTGTTCAANFNCNNGTSCVCNDTTCTPGNFACGTAVTNSCGQACGMTGTWCPQQASGQTCKVSGTCTVQMTQQFYEIGGGCACPGKVALGNSRFVIRWSPFWWGNISDVRCTWWQ